MSDDAAAESSPDVVDDEVNDEDVNDEEENGDGGTTVAVLEFLVKSIVDEPDAVSVEVDDGRTLRLDVHVAGDDMGRVIGRRGRTADAIRTVVNAAAAQDGRKVDVEFVD